MLLFVLQNAIKDMKVKAFPIFPIIEEVPVEDMPEIWGTKGKENGVEEEGGKRATKRKKRER